MQNLLNQYTYWAPYRRGDRLLAQGANNEGGYVQTGRVVMLTLAYAF